MRPLQVEPDGLHRLATRCRAWSSELCSMSAPIAGESISATGAAAEALDGAVRTTAEDLADRMRGIADLLDQAADVHRAAENESSVAFSDGTVQPS